jgi:hypothetical protein
MEFGFKAVAVKYSGSQLYKHGGTPKSNKNNPVVYHINLLIIYSIIYFKFDSFINDKAVFVKIFMNFFYSIKLNQNSLAVHQQTYLEAHK